MQKMHPATPASVYRMKWPFKTFLLDRLILTEIGRPFWNSHFISARGMIEAERIAALNEWKVLGAYHGDVDAGAACSAFCDAVVSDRDREWVTPRENGGRF